MADDESELNVNDFVSQVEDIQRTPAGTVTYTNGPTVTRFDVPRGFLIETWAKNAWPNNVVRKQDIPGGVKVIVDNDYQTQIEYVLRYKGLV